jgi:hypothetical protein
MVRKTKTPYRYTVPVGILGLVTGWLLGVLIGWEPVFVAVGGCLLAQVALDAWWARR